MKKLLYTVFVFLFTIVAAQAQANDDETTRTRTVQQENTESQDASTNTSASEKARVEKVLAKKRAEFEARKKAGEPTLRPATEADKKPVQEKAVKNKQLTLNKTQQQSQKKSKKKKSNVNRTEADKRAGKERDNN